MESIPIQNETDYTLTDDMTQQIPLRILRARISHVQAETPEDDLGIGLRPAVHGHAGDLMMAP